LCEQALIIEVDGDSHFTSRGLISDAQRSAALKAQGLHVIRFTNLEVMQDFEAVCQRIEDALNA
jgi:very-short-patch-repair endonuclease